MTEATWWCSCRRSSIGISAFDRDVGRFGRYRRNELLASFERAGLEPRTAHDVNAPALIAWILLMGILGRRPGDRLALRAFEAVVPALRWLERLASALRAIAVRGGATGRARDDVDAMWMMPARHGLHLARCR